MRLSILIFLFSFMLTNVSNDSLAVLIEKGHTEILDVVKYKDPLADKIGGVEINPLY